MNKVIKIFKKVGAIVENDHFVGRTQFDSPEVDNEVWAPVDVNYVRMGDFATVEITEASHYDLTGKLV